MLTLPNIIRTILKIFILHVHRRKGTNETLILMHVVRGDVLLEGGGRFRGPTPVPPIMC